MLKTVIIADDLTGANDTGAILAKNGMKVGTLLQKSDINKFNKFDVLCITTNSRALKPSEAYDRVKDAANMFKNKDELFFSKRIDSTLRGNVGYEIDSIIDTLGEDTFAIVVASFPDSGRVSIGDILLVNGIPLEKTEVVKDPTCPVKTSRITEIVKTQTKYNVGFVPLDKVLKGSETIKNEIIRNAKDGNRVIIIDAYTNDDISEIARACIDSKLKFVAVDPGPFTAVSADLLNKDKDKETLLEGKVLCGIGSASSLTRQQIKSLKEKYNPLIIKTNTVDFLDDEKRGKEIERVVDEITSKEDNYNTLLVTTTLEDNDVLDFSVIKERFSLDKKECANLITESIAEIIYTIIEKLDTKVGSVYTSGGDVTEAFCNRIRADGIEVLDEVVPLAIYGKVIGGICDKKPILTKGGLVGKDDTLITCVEYLYQKMDK